jgi:hypothetical protein
MSNDTYTYDPTIPYCKPCHGTGSVRHSNDTFTPCTCRPEEDTTPDLTFSDALRIARGCHDYNGGHRKQSARDIYHQGIQTVCNALEGLARSGLWDTQTAALWRMGGEMHTFDEKEVTP